MNLPTTLPEAWKEIDRLQARLDERLRSIKPAHEQTGGLGHIAADWRDILETLPDIVFKLDLQGHLTAWNKRMESVTGFTPEELTGRPALWFVPEDEQAKTAEAIARALREGQAELRGHLVTRDGRAIPYHWTGAVLKDALGEVIGITGVGRDVSDQLAMERRLQASEETHRVLFDLSPLMCFLIDPDGTVLKVNRQGAVVLGYEPDELIGRSVLAVFPEDQQEAARSHVAACLAAPQGTLLQWELVKQRKDGRRLWVREFARSWRDQRGFCTILIACEDITAAKQSEEALRVSEEQFRRIFDNAPLGLCLVASDKRLFRVNQQLCNITGYTEAELIGQTYELYTHPDDLRGNLALTEQFFRGERPGYSLEKRYRCKGGTEKWVAVSTVAIPMPDHTDPVLLAMVEDITDRRQAERVLQLSQFTIDHAVNAIYWIDADAKIIRVNRAACDMLGYGEDELCRLTVHDLNPEFPPSSWPAFWADTLRRRTMTLESVHRTKQGALIPIEIQINCLTYEGRDLHCAFVRDITERKRAEEALRRAMSERESLSQDLHDGILQSLYAVGLNLEACKPHLNPVGSTMVRSSLERAIGHLNRVMREVRHFIAGLDPNTLADSPFAASLETMVQSMTAGQSLSCTVAIDPQAAALVPSERALHVINIVREALSNSLRHSGATQATVRLNTLASSIRLIVSDNGQGFDPGPMRGTGHGMANMAARARKMRGRLSIRSAPGYGTRITIYFPKE